MWKEIIEKKRWIIMVPIVMVILLLISLETKSNAYRRQAHDFRVYVGLLFEEAYY